MDPIQSALCLLVGFAIPLAGLFLLFRRGMRQLQVSHAYVEVARRLGLDVDTRGTSLQGHLGDRRLWIGEVMVGHGPERRMMTWGVLDLTRPLTMGLLLRRRGRTTRLLRRGSAPDALIGTADLDRLLQVQGDDAARVRQLFAPPVRTALRALMDVWPEVAVTDRAVRVHLNRAEPTTARLELLVSSLLELADALEISRRDVAPPDRLRADLAVWQAAAEATSLQVEPWLPAMSGEFDGYRVLVASRRTSTGYRAGLRLWFHDHPQTGLRLRRQNEPDGYWSVGQDIQVDDELFDASFVIKGWDPSRVRELLSADARSALLALSARGQPEVDDRCLYVEDIEITRDSLVETIRHAVLAAKSLGW